MAKRSVPDLSDVSVLLPAQGEAESARRAFLIDGAKQLAVDMVSDTVIVTDARQRSIAFALEALQSIPKNAVRILAKAADVADSKGNAPGSWTQLFALARLALTARESEQGASFAGELTDAYLTTPNAKLYGAKGTMAGIKARMAAAGIGTRKVATRKSMTVAERSAAWLRGLFVKVQTASQGASTKHGEHSLPGFNALAMFDALLTDETSNLAAMYQAVTPADAVPAGLAESVTQALEAVADSPAEPVKARRERKHAKAA